MAKRKTDDNDILEKVQDAGPKSIEYYESSIEAALIEFSEREGFENPRDMPSNVWDAALMYCHKKCIVRDDLMLYKKDNNNINYTPNSSYQYDIDKITELVELYIYLCNKYNKQCTVIGFSFLSGVSDETISQWGRNDKVTSNRVGIYKRLHNQREHILSNKLFDNGNAVAQISILNHYYGWNLPGVSREQAKPSLSVDDIRQQIGIAGGQAVGIESGAGQIPEKPDNNT